MAHGKDFFGDLGLLNEESVGILVMFVLGVLLQISKVPQRNF